MSDSLSGAFLCSGFTARRSTATQAFCKPVNVRIYSAPPPTKHRVVTYQMSFIGVTDPILTPTSWSDAEAYQSPYSGERSFSYITGTLEVELDDVLNDVRRHFYKTVLGGLTCPPEELAFARFMKENNATRRYEIDEETLIRVSKVHHLRRIYVDASGVHIDQRAIVRYQGEITNIKGVPVYVLDYVGKYISCNHVYSSTRNLLSAAVDHFKRPEVRDHVIATLKITE